MAKAYLLPRTGDIDLSVSRGLLRSDGGPFVESEPKHSDDRAFGPLHFDPDHAEHWEAR